MKKANYILLDAARMNGAIQEARDLNPDHTCLYEGDSEKFLAAVAPWLFAFEPGSDFARWAVRQGKGNSWGILFRSEVEPVRLYKHLRRFLIIQTEEGKELYFRYYDPRVLRVFLPTCDKDQLREFFGPITAFVAEDENGLLVEYALSDNELLYAELEGSLEGLATGTTGVPKLRAEQIPEEATQTAIVQEPEPIREQRPPSKGWDFGY
ncbi:MAG: DUF4123 domain-containing protein [Flavobacteriales bacterium]